MNDEKSWVKSALMSSVRETDVNALCLFLCHFVHVYACDYLCLCVSVCLSVCVQVRTVRRVPARVAHSRSVQMQLMVPKIHCVSS